jgi:hypothetical protein
VKTEAVGMVLDIILTVGTAVTGLREGKDFSHCVNLYGIVDTKSPYSRINFL